ncbi:response regulator transcription factor [Pseudomonas extremaustralis]|jgi:two-component system response regulator PfeR|uniref:Response regulator transcription factor n=1 Tax=Pseudomonas extremaustralis TaxID=359110 RepID=A0A5C5Q191_9PSED|nr:response regulator transcription factor [Pseudomonas extremaustralis]EZI23996.1 transcriptional regulator [Pseudomonas extremaustralis 14-3 substr. 14-3b]MDB1113235.1 response regulator transcription factor [Pseudomonas extremaustralis]TWR98206.1 response regulator transcription factor [Pseudomonas extremaustralis]SDE82603.1 two-component system, OmpR family, response regulator PfeR [Pseudomonas extremaustralis]SKA89801.1 two-component system, OmpR family, response regulator PfeR [Pseudomon
MNPVAIDLPRILTIEDDPVLGAYVHEHLGRCGFQVTWCQNGQQGLQLARDQAFDVVLMDILLPGLDGLSILTHLRRSHSIPVILMSALGAEADRVSGFRLGADDYLPKPFSMIELRVRIEAILRRVALDRRPLPSLAPVRDDVHTLRFDDELCDVFHQEHWAGLTRSEYRLLETLHRNSEEVLSKAFLYQHVLQRGYAPHDRSLDMHISQIRRKLKAIGYSEYQVRTVWGKGYVLSGHDAGL